MIVWANEIIRLFRGGGLTKERILATVLTVLEDKVTNVGHDECTLCAGQIQDPGEVSDEHLVIVKEKVCISKGGFEVSYQ